MLSFGDNQPPRTRKQRTCSCRSSQRHTECKEYPFLASKNTSRAVRCNGEITSIRKSPEKESACVFENRLQNARGQQQKQMSAMRYRRCKKSMLHMMNAAITTPKMNAKRKRKLFEMMKSHQSPLGARASLERIPSGNART